MHSGGGDRSKDKDPEGSVVTAKSGATQQSLGIWSDELTPEARHQIDEIERNSLRAPRELDHLLFR